MFLLACLNFTIALYLDLKDYLLNHELKSENLVRGKLTYKAIGHAIAESFKWSR